MKVRLLWTSTETGDLIEDQIVELSTYRSDNPNSPSQRIILDEIRQNGKYENSSFGVKVEITLVKKGE